MKNANQVRDPSPDEIRKQCRKIQKEWSDSTWRQRAIRRRKPWTVPELHAIVSDNKSYVKD